MTIKQVVTPVNLGKTIKPAGLVENKFDVNIDGTTITADVNGVLSAAGQNLSGLIATGNRIATITNPANGNTVDLNETITTLSNSGNIVTHTNEAGTVITFNKVDAVTTTVNNTAKTLQVAVNGVVSNTVDISGFYADINVDTVSYDGSVYILTLTETDGTVHTIDLSSLVGVTSQATATVSISGDGSVTDPLTADVLLDALSSNLITATPNGLLADKAVIFDVEVQDAFGVPQYRAASL